MAKLTLKILRCPHHESDRKKIGPQKNHTAKKSRRRENQFVIPNTYTVKSPNSGHAMNSEQNI